MSVQAHPVSKVKEFHGVKLAQNSAIINLVIQRMAADPSLLEVGRFWYNLTDRKFKLVNADVNGNPVVETFGSAEAFTERLETLITDLSSTAAGKGTSLIGFEGFTDEPTTKGTLKATLDALNTAIKANKAEYDVKIEDLASQEAELGSALIGYKGVSKTVEGEEVEILPASNLDEALSSLATTVSQQGETLRTEFVSKNVLEDQVIKSSIIIEKDVTIKGNINHLGENIISSGTTVELGDNIIRLNRELGADQAPVTDAGIEVNRGTEGILSVLTWSESDKRVVVPVINPDTKVVTQDIAVVRSELDTATTTINQTITDLDDRISQDLEDLNTALTDEIGNSLAQVRQDLDAHIEALAAPTGAEMVGFTSNGGYEVIDVTEASTVADHLNLALSHADLNAVNHQDLIDKLASTEVGEGASGIGVSTIGIDGASFEQTLTVQEALNQMLKGFKHLVDKNQASKFTVVSSAKKFHTITHNLGHDDIIVQLWVKDGANWMNHSANITIIDLNTIEVNLNSEAEIKVCILSAQMDEIVDEYDSVFPQLATPPAP